MHSRSPNIPLKPLTLVGLGCGPRTRTYCEIAASLPDRYQVVGAADPNPARVEQIRKISGLPGFRAFASDKELFAAGKIADVCVIGTQDAYHVEPCRRAMELGYDVLLEKPISADPRQIAQLLAESERLGRKVLICHVLRYAPFYTKVKEIIDSGALGEIMSIDAREGVDTWHQAHSYVRGNHSVTGRATPMLISKSCHDTDIISWLVGKPCTRVQSFGSLSYYTAANAPAGAPLRCTDPCPVAATCGYNALLYASQHRGWLKLVMDGVDTASEADIRAWLTWSPWGRCVYRCDNDAVDHQTLSMEFAGGATGTFTMTAFDWGRHLIISGTKGVLRGGHAVRAMTGHDIIVEQMLTYAKSTFNVVKQIGGYEGHEGGDAGLVQALDQEFAKPAREMRSGLHASVESHLMGFAAEESRHRGVVVTLEEYRYSLA